MTLGQRWTEKMIDAKARIALERKELTGSMQLKIGGANVRIGRLTGIEAGGVKNDNRSRCA
jgi:hypothetical protein